LAEKNNNIDEVLNKVFKGFGDNINMKNFVELPIEGQALMHLSIHLLPIKWQWI